MRPWRKLHSSILESERFMDVPLESKVLFFLLIAAQDDTGYYPWERIKVRRLVATCGWSEAQAKRHADGLVTGGMATWEEGGIVLRKGEELNGRLRGDREPVLYQRSSTDIPVTDTDIPVVNPEGEREESKSKKRVRGDTRATSVDEIFILAMIQKYPQWSESEVREQILDAQAHTAWKKWDDKQRYVMNWLRRNANERSSDGKQPRAGARFDNSDLKFLRASLDDMPRPSPPRRAEILAQIAEMERTNAAHPH